MADFSAIRPRLPRLAERFPAANVHGLGFVWTVERLAFRRWFEDIEL
jgi:hypothetical protein